MSWKCDYCDSFNEDRAMKCYVCGKARSIESVKETFISERKAIPSIIDSFVTGDVFGILPLIYYLIVLVSALCIIGYLVYRIIYGTTYELLTPAFSLVKKACENVSFVTDSRVNQLFLVAFTEHYEHFCSFVAPCIKSVVSNNCDHLVHCLVVVLQQSAINLNAFWSYVVALLQNLLLSNSWLFANSRYGSGLNSEHCFDLARCREFDQLIRVFKEGICQ